MKKKIIFQFQSVYTVILLLRTREKNKAKTQQSKSSLPLILLLEYYRSYTPLKVINFTARFVDIKGSNN